MRMQKSRNSQVTHLLQVRQINTHGIDDSKRRPKPGEMANKMWSPENSKPGLTVEKREVARRVACGIDDLELRLPHHNNVALCNEFQVRPSGLKLNAHAVTSRFMTRSQSNPSALTWASVMRRYSASLEAAMRLKSVRLRAMGASFGSHMVDETGVVHMQMRQENDMRDLSMPSSSMAASSRAAPSGVGAPVSTAKHSPPSQIR